MNGEEPQLSHGCQQRRTTAGQGGCQDDGSAEQQTDVEQQQELVQQDGQLQDPCDSIPAPSQRPVVAAAIEHCTTAQAHCQQVMESLHGVQLFPSSVTRFVAKEVAQKTDRQDSKQTLSFCRRSGSSMARCKVLMTQYRTRSAASPCTCHRTLHPSAGRLSMEGRHSVLVIRR